MEEYEYEEYEEYEEEEEQDCYYEGKFNNYSEFQEADDDSWEQESCEEKEEVLQEEQQKRRRATPRRRRIKKRRRCTWKRRPCLRKRRRGPNGGGQRKILDTVLSPSLHLFQENIDTGLLNKNIEEQRPAANNMCGEVFRRCMRTLTSIMCCPVRRRRNV